MANGIMPICNICERQFADDTAYAKHLAEAHGIHQRVPQMDLSMKDNSASAALAAKDAEIASLKKELDEAIASAGNTDLIKAKDDEIAALRAELDTSTEENKKLLAEIKKLEKKLAAGQ